MTGPCCGLPGGDRTPDPQLRRLLLYPTELRAEIARENGRGERIRTFDPLVPNQMRYQAALRPDMPHCNGSNPLFLPSIWIFSVEYSNPI